MPFNREAFDINKPIWLRFFLKVDKNGPGGCWTWTGSPTVRNYGEMRFHGRTHRAHRVSFFLHNGYLTEGLDVDHTCHNADKSCRGGNTCPHRLCVNPKHLVERPRRDNLELGTHYFPKSHCNSGHPLDGDNIYLYKGKPRCRECMRQANQRARDKKKLNSYGDK